MELREHRRKRNKKISNLRKGPNDFNYWVALSDLSNEQSYSMGVQDGCDRTNDRWIAVIGLVLTAIATAIIVGEALLRVFITRDTDSACKRAKRFARWRMSGRGFFYCSF